jgi:hypothetical protein
VKEIPLTQGKVALIDDEDYEMVSRYRWNAYIGGKRWYAKTNIQVPGVGQRTLRMHTLIMGVDPDGKHVDHRNLDGLDNRRSNLRWATRSQQKQNNAIRIDGSSGYRGVFWYRPTKKWLVQINANGKRFHVGYFSGAADAARAYDAKARELHGEFARLNFE